ncbi:MAG: PAS-domain containing protein [Planktomarina sp.]
MTFTLVLLTLSAGLYLLRLMRRPHCPTTIASGDFSGPAANHHPDAMWMMDTSGNILWRNGASQSINGQLIQISQGWQSNGQTNGRTNIQPQQDKQQWYDLTSRTCDAGIIWYASPADAEMQAENAKKEFVQTLAKTFAHLSTGLAIFDRDRHLVMFNPALLELTGLPFEHLSQRPTLSTLLDMLRAKGLVPEPRNYAEWRGKIDQLEAEAENGSYCDIWNLPDNVTYRVTGKPHPGGAIAVLIEDISTEVSRTRTIRNELNVFQSIFNASSAKFAVFDGQGDLVMTNAEFDALWKMPESIDDRSSTILDCLRIWQSSCHPNPAWGDVRDFVSQATDRVEWSATIEMYAGDPMRMQCTPLADRHTLVEFSDVNLSVSAWRKPARLVEFSVA